jgi:uncharacterized protein with GYD domain
MSAPALICVAHSADSGHAVFPAAGRAGTFCASHSHLNPDGHMPMFLWRGNYSPEGARGLMKEGGTKRRAAIQQLVKKAGGKIHGFYFGIGSDDVYVVSELPDNETAVAISMAVNATGAVSLSSTPLLTAEELDEALKKSIPYRAPGT